MKLWVLILARAVIMFAVTLTLVRIMGRYPPLKHGVFAEDRPFGQIIRMVLAVVAALTALSVINNMVMGLIILAVWALLPPGLESLARQSGWVYFLLHGRKMGRGHPPGCVLVKEGRVIEDNLWRARLSGDELLRELHAKHRLKLSDVEFAVLDNSGRIQVFPKGEYPLRGEYPLPPGDRQGGRTEPQTVALGGNILGKTMTELGLTPEWLRGELQKSGVALADVFLAQADAAGDLYLDLYDDTVDLPQPKVKEMLYANLLKTRADFMTFALESKDPAVKAMYTENAAKMKTMLGKLKPLLLQ